MSTNLEITPRSSEAIALLKTAKHLLEQEGVWENLEQLGDWCPAKVGRERDEALEKLDSRTLQTAFDASQKLEKTERERDELRAENERLEKSTACLARINHLAVKSGWSGRLDDFVESVCAELLEIRRGFGGHVYVPSGGYGDLCSNNRELRAEVERLRLREQLNDAQTNVKALTATVDNVRAENGRLRGALERLRDCDWVISLPDRMDAVRAIAREALAAKKEQP
jgi:cell division protein FtsB